MRTDTKKHCFLFLYTLKLQIANLTEVTFVCFEFLEKFLKDQKILTRTQVSKLGKLSYIKNN
jgi:hypothetical protein